MYVASHIIKEGACLSGECSGIKSIGNGEGQIFPLHGFLGILETIRGSGNYSNLLLLEIGNA